jgi:hypothetical protein
MSIGYKSQRKHVNIAHDRAMLVKEEREAYKFISSSRANLGGFEQGDAELELLQGREGET